MGPVFFHLARAAAALIAAILACAAPAAEPRHAIAMYGDPALPPDFVSLPYANPDAPKGGRIVFGNTGGFDSLNPFIQKGTPPWQQRFWGYEALMGRSQDEPFTLYGLLAESVRVAPDRSWVEFTLREEARFSDGSPVTVEDVIWSYETLGTQGHLRYRTFWTQVERIEKTGPRSLRLDFNSDDRELALIAGMRPILKKAQWEGRDFTASGLDEIPIGTGPYVIEAFEPGRSVTFTRNPDYWGADLPLRRGTHNFDEMRIEFYGDQSVLFEAFKAGALDVYREFNAEKWARDYDFPAVQRGEIVLSEIPHGRPSGMTGFAMNTRRAPFDDWRVREALMLAFNFDYINDTLTGGVQPRITSYFSGSELAMRPGPAEGAVRALLEPYADTLPPGAMEGYALPTGVGTKRHRGDLRRAVQLLDAAGWRVGDDGVLRNAEGRPFRFSVLLRQSDKDMLSAIDIYARALDRLGIAAVVERVDDAQFTARTNEYDFDMTTFRRDLSLSPGNEQKLYWGSYGVETPGTRNLMGVDSAAVDGLIETMLRAETREEFIAAVRALDRVLTAGRYVIPIWSFDMGRIAHVRRLRYPDALPVYGDRMGFLPDVWWSAPE
ncbi:MAG TPA: ABC transporter substrate-binding protein [Rhodobacteraceae bacterium]|nr:ABC transporter substrate-binding protein [Paracoccaceae bacterium]